MARSQLRQRAVLQESPFLDLPGEIRMMIYHAALVRPEPLDFWPRKYIEKPEDDSSLASRIAKAHAKLQSTPKFREQDDLLYVRKIMATGLLATCRQIFKESHLLFWKGNTFRFSGDNEWLGLRRFLVTIGPRPISWIQKVEVFAPLRGIDDEEVRNAKNSPKMQMSKVFKSKEYQMEQNVSHICHLLIDLKSSLELHFILPKGYSLDENLSGTFGSFLYQLYIPHEIKDSPPYTRMNLIIESGAYLKGPYAPQKLVDQGLDVICLPGSFRIQSLHGTIDDSTEIVEAMGWKDPLSEYEFLVGLTDLLSEEVDISSVACGGKTNKSSGPRKTERILKGFGGCKFTSRSGWNCSRCGGTSMFPGRSPEYGWIWETCLYCGTMTPHELQNIIELSKVRRAIRQGVVRTENVARRL